MNSLGNLSTLGLSIPYPASFLFFLGRQNTPFMTGQGQSSQGDMESPPDFSFWAAALTLILVTGFLYASKYFGLTGSAIIGLIAAYFAGSIFNSIMRLLIFLIKLAIYTAILILAGYYFLQLFPGILQ